MNQAPPIGLRRSWVMVALLTMMAALSFIDRLILNVLADPISKDLRISDTQLGLLMGTGFAVLYSLASLPLAHCVDSYNRKRLVLFGVTLWSAMTFASGFAQDFGTLLLLRSGVGIGEAVLMPAAISLIADMFAKDRRALPVSIITAVGSFMGSASLAVGGLALALAGKLAFTGLEPWRITFLLVGAPGLAVAAAFAVLAHEPARTGDRVGGSGEASLSTFLAYLGEHRGFYVPLFAAGTALAFFAYSMLSWAPTILIRSHGFTAAGASIAVGVVLTPVKLLALVFWPWLAVRIERRDFHMGVPRGLLYASIWAIPFLLFTPISGNAGLFVAGLCMAIVTSSAFAVLPSVGFQIYAPKRMVGRLSAILTFGTNLIGFGMGPLLAVFFGQLWAPVAAQAGGTFTTSPIAFGLATNGAIALPVMLVGSLLCLRNAKKLPVT